ncbi:hypothetical protein IVB22_02095 [Bradyrhizobium sp. 190]|uniref:hypothetical protein n=1 Tax=Bradyrhizobium sp. 190 TaxID=2782658 RepID=UPI001FFA580F|nr:hypothetical protein [Bradyrhizobium sp. 190]MCK1511382.1 hypothetical protein [Bradyrhizobium sp. 190]
MATTENISPKAQETEPVKALFDLASYWATIWGFVALCLWLEHRVLTALDIQSDSIQIAVLGASTVAIFWLTLNRVEKDPKARLIVDRARYIVILAAAVLLGAYLHATHKDQSYESHLRDGAVLACAEIAACKESVTQYANTR